MQPQLVFVEGIHFSGKSTTAEYVAAQFQSNGLPEEWLWEINVRDGFFAPSRTAARQQLPNLANIVRADWAKFITFATPAGEIVVVDGMLSYTTVYPLLATDMSQEAIAASVQDIAKECRSLNPTCLHLVGDVD